MQLSLLHCNIQSGPIDRKVTVHDRGSSIFLAYQIPAYLVRKDASPDASPSDLESGFEFESTPSIQSCQSKIYEISLNKLDGPDQNSNFELPSVI